ncbi:MAG: sigma-54-dependent Fis family transcriptional regulator [Deltaproteobacteria bacterium]|nr:sigma-54-dependent Fis family transcriptional regulator [Deltaproteobacteria bacterium]
MDDALSIMVVDDEAIVRESLYHWFKRYGHRVEATSSGPEALARLEKKPFDVMFVDVKMPGMSGLEVLQKVKESYPETIVVIITAYGSIDTAVEAMKMGATDYLLKPFKPDQFNLVLQKITHQRRLSSEYHYIKGLLEEFTRFDNIIGQSRAMQEVFGLIPEIAQSEASVLISGETGTGKELVAKAIHAKSLRAKGPFIAINCGAIPDTLLESELFGHQKGAFTGADQARKGFLEVASGGTLFLDEIGEISPNMQIDLLRVLEERKVIKLGDRDPVDVDFRLISSTRRDLAKEVSEGQFREDFFYRINVITVTIPPLRKRKEDISLLVQHFLEKYSHETVKQVDRVTPEALELLKGYNWPGNVRELENAIERAVVLSKSRTLGIEDFLFLRRLSPQTRGPKTLREMEKEYIQAVLEENDWNITHSAKVLGINRVTLHKMIKRYDLERLPRAGA